MILKKILLAEDNPNDAELTLEALNKENLANEVVWLKDGQDTLDYLRCEGDHAGREKINPGLILLDLKMPRVDGLQVLQEVKADPLLSNIPVVILTSSREERDLVACYKHGVNAFVVKPVNFSDFMNCVSSLGVFWALLNETPPLEA